MKNYWRTSHIVRAREPSEPTPEDEKLFDEVWKMLDSNPVKSRTFRSAPIPKSTPEGIAWLQEVFAWMEDPQ